MIDDFLGGKKPKPIPNQKSGIFLPDPLEEKKPESTEHFSYNPEVIKPTDNANAKPAFLTPEQMGQQGDSTVHTTGPLDTAFSSVDGTPMSNANGKLQSDKKQSFMDRLKALSAWRPTRTQAGLIVAAAVILGTGGTMLGMALHKKPAPKPQAAAVKPKPAPPAPKPITSPLTGVTVTPEQQKRPVTAVMIENSPDARPQSGLDQAGVVFEAIAEGGITRFMALFQETNPSVIGPIRSSRPYYLDWAQGFDAAYAHVGGSPDALQKIKADGVKDLDQFYNASAYHRVSTRYAPHNVYSSIDALVSLEANKGWTASAYTPLPRKDKETPSASPNAASINMSISGAYYNVHYDYDKAANSYNRSEGGAVHIDNETKKQLSPKVVIALAMPYSLMTDGYHSSYQTIGTGKMLVFQDGTVQSGNWSKDSSKDNFVFKDDAGKTLALNPGQTWITAVGDISKVTYQ